MLCVLWDVNGKLNEIAGISMKGTDFRTEGYWWFTLAKWPIYRELVIGKRAGFWGAKEGRVKRTGVEGWALIWSQKFERKDLVCLLWYDWLLLMIHFGKVRVWYMSWNCYLLSSSTCPLLGSVVGWRLPGSAYVFLFFFSLLFFVIPVSLFFAEILVFYVLTCRAAPACVMIPEKPRGQDQGQG